MVVAAVARWTLGGGCGGGGVVAATPAVLVAVGDGVAEVAVTCAGALLCACVHVRGRVCESLRACVRRDCVARTNGEASLSSIRSASPTGSPTGREGAGLV